MSGGLGRRVPTDDKHIRRYSLTTETMPLFPTPVCIGINCWYQGFDNPIRDSRNAAWLPKQDAWGAIRGGHEICIKPPRLYDPYEWYRFYDQGNEGACVGFALSRMMSLLNRVRYDARWLYQQAQLVDDWADTPPEEGTSGRAGCDILRRVGHRRIHRGFSNPPDAADGILENRWCTSVEQIAVCLDPDSGGALVLNAGYVTLLNSWGTAYPHLTRMDLESLERLVYREDGDATLITDRPT